MIYLLYGQPGTGKSTLGTGIAIEYAMAGKKVAANFHIDFAPVSFSPKKPFANQWVTVLPDRPTFDQLKSIGTGWHPADVGREDRAGLLLIDESGPWLNSRTWNDKERQSIIDWFLHSRKRGWDIIFIAQAPSLLDKQIREAVIEGYARCRRTDRMKVPIIGVRLPRLHIAVARYGLDQNAPILERWFYRGNDVHQCFNSHALFDADNGPVGPYSTLPARITKWRTKKLWMERIADHLAGKRSTPLANGKPKPKHRIAELLARLPHDQALRHWRRLNGLGAFDAARAA